MFTFYIRLIYYIVIALVGIIGNTTTIIVFSQRRLRSLRSSFFLTCLAITDLVFILVLIVVWLDEIHVPVMTAPVCMFTIYVSHIASFLSSNFTLAYTSHRLIAVFFPIKAASLLKQRTNRIVAIILFLFACSFYSLAFPVTNVELRPNSTNLVKCMEDKYPNLLSPFLMLDSGFTFLIPFSLITCMNLAIAYRLHSQSSFRLPKTNEKTSNQLKSLQSPSTTSIGEYTTCSSPSTLNHLKTSIYSSGSTTSICSSNKDGHSKRSPEIKSFLHSHSLPTMSHKNVRLISDIKHGSVLTKNVSLQIHSNRSRTTASAKTTKMLLAASTAFLVFNLPYHTLLFCFLIKHTPNWLFPAINIARFWFFGSFCVNFFVYAICGKRFRHEVVRLFGFSALRRLFSKSDRETRRKTCHKFSSNSHFFTRRSISQYPQSC